MTGVETRITEEITAINTTSSSGFGRWAFEVWREGDNVTE